jgi:hypothetical protein
MNITDNELTELYERFNTEHQLLMQQFVNTTDDIDIQKQISQLNTLLMAVLKFKSIRKKIESKKSEVGLKKK